MTDEFRHDPPFMGLRGLPASLVWVWERGGVASYLITRLLFDLSLRIFATGSPRSASQLFYTPHSDTLKRAFSPWGGSNALY